MHRACPVKISLCQSCSCPDTCDTVAQLEARAVQAICLTLGQNCVLMAAVVVFVFALGKLLALPDVTKRNCSCAGLLDTVAQLSGQKGFFGEAH